MAFQSPAADYIERSISLDQELIHRPAATFFMRSAQTYWRAGIMQGALLVVDRAATAVDGSIVVCSLAGEFVLKRLRLSPLRCLESLDNPAVRQSLPEVEDDGVFGVVTYSINDTRSAEFDDCPIM